MLRRIAVGALALWLAASLVFFAVHLGPRAPVEEVPGDDPALSDREERRALAEKKTEFGLRRPLSVQYADYLTSMATFDFGESWASRGTVDYRRDEPITDVNKLVFGDHLHRTLWLWGWTLVFAALGGTALAVGLRYSSRAPELPGVTLGGALLRALPVVLLANAVDPVLSHSEQLLFGFDWTTFLVDHYGLSGPIPLEELGTREGLLVATKETLPFAMVLALALLPTTVRLARWVARTADRASWPDGSLVTGIDTGRHVRADLRRTGPPLTSLLTFNLSVLMGGTLYVEAKYQKAGLGSLFLDAVANGDYTTAQAILFVATVVLVGARLLEEAVYVVLAGVPEDRDDRAVDYWIGNLGGATTVAEDGIGRLAGIADAWGGWADDDPTDDRLRVLARRSAATLPGRVRERPLPAAVWVTVGAALLALEAGAVLNTLELVPLVPALADLPTLLSRDLIPNLGYHEQPGGDWKHTAFGLSPAHAWALRAGLVYLYALAWAGWLVGGYRVYRSVYRAAENTPVDAAVRRFRAHAWGQFGLVVVAFFVVAGLFAPTLSATPFEAVDGDQERRIKVYDSKLDIVRTMNLGYAFSEGSEQGSVDIWGYGRFTMFRPLGSGWSGDTLLSLLGGIRTFIVTAALAGAVGLGLALATLAARRSRVLDVATAGAAEILTVLPTVPAALLFVDQFRPHFAETSPHFTAAPAVHEWLGTFAMTVVLAVMLWPALWRTLRAPAALAGARGWVTAARGFGASEGAGVRRHVLPRILGQAVVYSLLTAVGVSIALPTISLVQYPLDYVRENAIGWVIGMSMSGYDWYDAAIPAVVGILLIFGLVCLADGIREAVDPTDAKGVSVPGEAAAAGGAG